MTRARLPAVIAAGVLVVGAGCAGGGEAPGRKPAGGALLVVSGYSFPALTVRAGETVRVVNEDDEPHTVTAEGGAFDVGPFDKKASASFKAPATAASYPYRCKIHPSMRGTLAVQ